MKMGEQHIVPLSRQAVTILRELEAITGEGKYLFPSLRTPTRCMSDNTVNAALRRLGYSKEEMTGHGFRSMASTCLNEQGWHPDLIELQLAHAERNKVRAAYNRAERIGERKKMMQSMGGLPRRTEGRRQGHRDQEQAMKSGKALAKLNELLAQCDEDKARKLARVSHVPRIGPLPPGVPC